MITETETKDKPSGKNVFTCCCPCIPSKSSKKEKKKKQKAIPKEFAEYEYVIENLAISKAPKICLDCAQPTPKPKKKSIRTTQTIKPSARDCSTLAVKTSPQEVVLGPVVQSTLSSGDCSALKEPHEKIEPCCPCPRGPLSKQMQYRCMIRDKIKDDFILKKILLPPGQVQRIEHPKLQVWSKIHKMKYSYWNWILILLPPLSNTNASIVSILGIFSSKNVPDIHKNPDEDSTMRKELKAIPAEIQKTIDALKIAKPQLGPSSLRRNRLNLIRSVSDTSCDNKETICNFLGILSSI